MDTRYKLNVVRLQIMAGRWLVIIGGIFLSHRPFICIVNVKYIFHWKNYRKYCILSKNNFWNTCISDKESSWADSCFWLLQVWFTHFPHNLLMSWEKLHAVVMFVASSRVSFFSTLFSKYILKTLAIFLASSKVGLKCE